MSLRDDIANRLQRPDDSQEPTEPLAVDVLTQTGIRADHSVPPLAPPDDDLTSTAPALSLPGTDDTSLALRQQDDLERRYRVVGRLGEGGMGVVMLADDRNLGRAIALKTIPPHKVDPERLARFVAEARITAQLEHPGIVPVHDLFISDEGDVYYTMKRVQGEALDEVLSGLRGGDPKTLVRHNLNHLLGVFLRACQAVAYAHTRRVIHRDLKPDNIMLGDFGEVLVMDWGVARLLDDAPEELRAVKAEGGNLLATADGSLVGSPAYMAPEALHADKDAIGPASDVFGLGVILYEILTLSRPFRADNLPRLLYLVARGEFDPPSVRTPNRDVPREVEAVCLKALARDPADRYADAGELVADLQAYIDGVGPRAEADRLVAEGRELLRLYARAASDAEEAEEAAQSMAAELDAWDPVDMKRLVHEAEHHRDDAVARADTVFGDCEAAFESALSHVRSYRPAREGLADLYWIRFLQSEERNNERWVRRWGELIQRYDPDRYEERLRGDGTVSLTLDPPDAEVSVARLEVVDGRLRAGPRKALGAGPIHKAPVALGSWQLELSAPGRRSIRVPLVVRRLQHRRERIRLLPQADIEPAFLHVPGGPVLLGGDSAAISSLPDTYADVDDFAIGRFPITVAEYAVFLAELATRDRGAAARHLPRERGGWRGRQQRALWNLPRGDGTLPIVDVDGISWHAEQPMVSIAIDDARAFASWRSRRDGRRYRLPTEFEWEKAARGEDRRIYPWGDRFDGSFCLMSESTPEPPDIPVLGVAAGDQSPYGVRDLGGGVRDWCEWAPQMAARLDRFPIRGGSYATVGIYCRAASRTLAGREQVGTHVGFRLVQEVR